MISSDYTFYYDYTLFILAVIISLFITLNDLFCPVFHLKILDAEKINHWISWAQVVSDAISPSYLKSCKSLNEM